MAWTSTFARFRFCLPLLLSLRLLLLATTGRAQTLPADQGLVADSTELRVLRQFYYATGGPQWTDHTNWLQGTTSADFATWQGVQVAGGDIVALSGAANNLRGPLPECLGELRQLVVLDLPANHLTGSLPAGLGQLTSLQYLALWQNQLSGSLPPELGQLTALRNFSLADNGTLTGSLPPELGNLTQLGALHLGNNHFSGSLPPELGNLRALTYLNLHSNQFQGPLPAALGQLTQLQELNLTYNQFSGPLPASWSQLSQLNYCYLDNNQLSGPLPAAWGLGQLGQLHHLTLTGNRLSGQIPPTWGGLTGLWMLTLSYNQLQGRLPAALANLQGLNRLQLDHNQLSGPLDVLSTLVNVAYLYANDNQFSGPLPASWSQLTRLTACFLGNNQLSGPLPPTLGALTSLGGLELQGNRLTGTIPAALLRLPTLSGLDLNNNQFTDIEDLGGATQLPALSGLANNQLSFAALERLYQGPGQSRFRGIWYNLLGQDARWQQQQPGVDTTSYEAGGALVLTPHEQPAPHGYAYQWQRLVGGQWANMPGDTLLTKTWPRATAAEQGTYRRIEHDRWFTDGQFAPTELYSRAIYADLLPYKPLVRNRPDDTNRPVASAVPVLATTLHLAQDTSRTGDVNFVRVWSPRVALTDSSRVRLAPVDSVNASTQYLDGLGRPLQSVHHQASPARRDLVQAEYYDGLGRSPYQLLPYAADPVTGHRGLHVNALFEQDAFYRRTTPVGGGAGPLDPHDPIQGVARTSVAYAQTQFEASPLNRVTAQGAPGEVWQLTGGHIVERTERPNTAADSVLWFVPGYAPQSLDPGYRGFYAPGELWGTDVSDAHGPKEPGEQGYRTLEWKDKLGQLVCKQVEANRTGTRTTGLHSRWLRTCYVYDDFQRLRFVLQPEASKRVLTAPLTGPAPLAQGLRLYLPMAQTSGTQAHDSTGRTAPAQLVDGGQWVPSPDGPHAQALRLHGTAHLVVPLAWQPAAFTIAFWVKPSQVLNYSCLLSANPDNAGQDPWGNFAFHTTSDGHISAGFNYWDAAGRLGSPDGLVQAGSWQHFAFTYQGGTGSLYCDGKLVSQLAGMPAAPAWPGLLLGMGASNTSLPFEGDVSELRVYERALPAVQVQQLVRPTAPAAAPLPPPVTALVAPYLFHYRYDGRGRQIAKQVPGQEGETLVVYDQLDRPVLSQDASQRTRKEWSWTKYDALGRIILSGLTSRGDTLGQVSLQALAAADTATSHQYEQRSADVTTYPLGLTTDQSFPQLGQGTTLSAQSFAAGQVLTATYYDDYDFNNDGQPDEVYDVSQDRQFPAGTAPVADVLRTTGMVTQTRTRVLGVADTDSKQAVWLTTTTFYDERARPVQVQTSNARKYDDGQQGRDVLTTRLDFTGKVVQSVASHQGPNLTQPLLVQEFFTYDHTGRLLTTRQQLPGEARPARLDSVSYNEVGQAVRKTLGTGRLQQQVDYAYNIRGWLTRLNDPYFPLKEDLFNLSLHYEQGFTAGYAQYNGNLTGQTWRGRDGVQRAYGYVYDPLNRLLQGDFVARQTTTPATPSAGAWQAEEDNYRLSFVSYDDNGNILTLRRRGLLQNATHATGKQYGAVDNLTYAYQGNRLAAVDDAVTGNQLPRPKSYNGAPTSLAGDFQEQGVQLGQEYLYDANGNLTQDKNKGITGIVYNHLNLPRQIHFGQGADSVVFRYTASGQKVAKFVYQTGRPTPLRTDYLGPYQYEQDSLKFFPHAEGRVLRFVSTDPAGTPHVSYQREFTLKDHLGNLRLAYRAGQNRTYLATLEQDENTRKRETQQFDSLSISPPVAQNVGGLARSGAYVARLNAEDSAPQPLGPLTQLGVQQGDTVTVTAYGLYQQPVKNGFFFSLASFITGLFHPASPPPPGLEAQKRKGLPTLQVGVAAGLASIPQLSGGVPQGYLRLLVFNRDSALVSQQVQQLTQAANGGYEQLRLQVILPQDGYVTAYVGSQSNVDVFFDDVQVEHRPGLQVQETEYDPWGLSLAGLDYTTPGLVGLNRYQFNGKERQLDLGLGWSDYEARFYDPAKGPGWLSPDPLADKMRRWSPYAFSFDNAIRFVDPDGMSPLGTEDIVQQGGGTKLPVVGGVAQAEIPEVTVTASRTEGYDAWPVPAYATPTHGLIALGEGRYYSQIGGIVKNEGHWMSFAGEYTNKFSGTQWDGSIKATGFEASVSSEASTDFAKASGRLQGNAFLAEANGGAGILMGKGNEFGANAKGTVGVYGLKGTMEGSINLLGFGIKMGSTTAIGAAYAEAGYNFKFNAKTGATTVGAKLGGGLVAGESISLEVTTPDISKIADYVRKSAGSL